MKKTHSLLLAPIISISLTVIGTPPSAAQKSQPTPPPPSQGNTPAQQSQPDLESAFSFLPEVVATCNNTKITDRDVRDSLPPRLVMLMANGYTPDTAQLQQIARETADQLINQKLLLEAATKNGFSPDTEAAAKEAEALQERVGDDKFKAGLKHQDITREALIQRMAEQMAVSQWIEEMIIPTIDTDEETLKKIYAEQKEEMHVPETIEASHILVKTEEGANEEAKQKARNKIEQLAKKIEKGADFAEVAEEHSDCPSSQKGGKLGPITPNDTVKPFSNAAFSLEEGEISDIVKTRFGFHIIKAGAKEPAHTPAFDDVKDELEQQVAQKELNRKLQEIVEQARQEANIKFFLDKETE